MIELHPHITAADIAYQLMKQEAKALETNELLDEIMYLLKIDLEDAQTRSTLYTSLNLDPRIVFLGKGLWGIRDWSAAAITAATSMPDLLPAEKSYQPKADDYLWDEEEDDTDDEQDILVPDEDPEKYGLNS